MATDHSASVLTILRPTPKDEHVIPYNCSLVGPSQQYVYKRVVIFFMQTHTATRTGKLGY